MGCCRLWVEKNLSKHSAAAVKAFVDLIDPRRPCSSAYAAVEGDALKALRLLHERGADLNRGDPQKGGTPSGAAAQLGLTATITLLAELRADVHKPRLDGVCPLQLASQYYQVDTAKLLLRSRTVLQA